MAVCIPAYKEEAPLKVLQSLSGCVVPPCNVTVFYYINAASNSSNDIYTLHQHSFDEIKNYSEQQNPFYSVELFLDHSLDPKKSGVGLARKSCMDAAVECFQATINATVLVCLDADCRVASNYLHAIFEYFLHNKKINATSIYFEHDLVENKLLQTPIIEYELHLRYLKNALQKSGFPWYYHTVGSSMAVRAQAYLQQGRMNTRQAGEDYYFLHKHMPNGFGEINTTCVYPGVRYSDRVPFGTGRAMLQMEPDAELKTYAPEIFIACTSLFKLIQESNNVTEIQQLKGVPNTLLELLEAENWNKIVQVAANNSADLLNFKKRLWTWFSGFTIIKILHTLRDKYHPDIPISHAVNSFLNCTESLPVKDLLYILRKMDKAEY